MTHFSRRIKTIDRLRGIICFCMIFFTFLSYFDNLPILNIIANHDLGTGIEICNGLMLADIVQPMFFFCIGLTFIPSLKKRISIDGRFKAYCHFVLRYLSFIGMGYLPRVIRLFSKGIPCFYLSVILYGLTLISLILYIIFTILKNENRKNLFLTITLILLSINGIINIVNSAVGQYMVLSRKMDYHLKLWGILQTVGLSGLIALLFAETKPITRIFASIVIFIIYSFIYTVPGNPEILDIDVDGGFIGMFMWAILILIPSVLSDFFYLDRRNKIEGNKTYYTIISFIVMLIIAIIGFAFFIINKKTASPGFIITSIIFGPISFLILYPLENKEFKINFFKVYGQSPILVFLLETIAELILDIIPNCESLPAYLAIIVVLLLTGSITFILYKLKDKRIKI